jgi:hypothetical protein
MTKKLLLPADINTRANNSSIDQAVILSARPIFNSLLSCLPSRDSAQFFAPPWRMAWVMDAHSRRQDPKTPVEQALMRGLGTA